MLNQRSESPIPKRHKKEHKHHKHKDRKHKKRQDKRHHKKHHKHQSRHEVSPPFPQILRSCLPCCNHPPCLTSRLLLHPMKHTSPKAGKLGHGQQQQLDIENSNIVGLHFCHDYTSPASHRSPLHFPRTAAQGCTRYTQISCGNGNYFNMLPVLTLQVQTNQTFLTCAATRFAPQPLATIMATVLALPWECTEVTAVMMP